MECSCVERNVTVFSKVMAWPMIRKVLVFQFGKLTFDLKCTSILLTELTLGTILKLRSLANSRWRETSFH